MQVFIVLDSSICNYLNFQCIESLIFTIYGNVYTTYFFYLYIFFVATQRIFISGPVVVSPSEEIIFEAYLPGLQLLNPKWWKKKDGSTKEIEINSEKYSVTIDHDNKYKFIILNAEEEDSAEYQISSTDMKSNAIYVHVDGKYIHYIIFKESYFS